jgi:hypothetical protein
MGSSSIQSGQTGRQASEDENGTGAWYPNERDIHLLALFDRDHKRGSIYHEGDRIFREGNAQALTFFPTDQVLLARILAGRDACSIHAGGVVLDGKGLLFAGSTGIGKSTMVTMLQDQAQILCDDRMIIRKWKDGFRIHGTWSHGDVPIVSPDSAPLRGIFFLEKAKLNRLIPIENKQEIVNRLLACLIQPLTSAGWWDKSLTLVHGLALEIPCYRLQFDKRGGVVPILTSI